MPQLVTVRVGRLRLWLPVVPALVVLLPVILFGLLGGLVACLATRVPPLPALRGATRLLWSLRGTQLGFTLSDHKPVSVRIY